MAEVNQLQILVKESGLTPAKATVILEKFQGYFAMAAEWEQKAKTVVVTNATQTAEMQMARAGRLFLREKRISLEKSRKELKEQVLREGKAIDGIANVLKALIVPIEDYLAQQENFVAIQKAKEIETVRIRVEAEMEAERIAKEQVEAEEQERIRLENEKLKADAVKREKKILADRKRANEKLIAERAKAEAEQAEIREAARVEQEKQQKILAEQKAKADTAEKKQREALQTQREEAVKKQMALEAEANAKQREIKAEAAKEQAKIDTEKRKAKAEADRLQKILDEQVECPFCHKKFTIKN